VSASTNIQKRLVVVARRCYPSWGVATLFLTQLLERVELLLLVVAQMAEMRRRILERLDLGEVRHDVGAVLYRGYAIAIGIQGI
jgi:hypothetical protein